jgi:tartrate dehydratase alpha subunit/fumarate hydratase class I-like protein
MAQTPAFKYAPMFQTGEDKTEYYLLTKDHVSVGEFEGKKILKVEAEGLTKLINRAFHDVNFMLRREHNEQVAKILSDPEATANDKYVALMFLRNAETAAKGILPFCQDTGTAIVHGEKGQQVWTGYCDEEAISKGVYKTYTEEALRQSQNAPLTMYEEVNTKCNLPAQIDIEATEGAEYKFLCVVKGGGSANKSYLYQETKAVLNPAKLVPYLIEKMKSLGTAACPPYHIAFVIGGTSAERTMLTVKLASCHYYDGLPTTGDETGRAFDEGGKHVSYDDRLNALVAADVLHPVLDGFHAAALLQREENQDGAENDDENADGGDDALQRQSGNISGAQPPDKDAADGADKPRERHRFRCGPSHADHKDERHQNGQNRYHSKQFNGHNDSFTLDRIVKEEKKPSPKVTL